MQKVLEKITAFTQLRYMKVLLNGFMAITAITICGSLFTLVKSIPIDAWQNFLTSSGLGTLLSVPISITTDAIALYVVLAMAYQTAKSFNKDGFSAALVGLGAFLILTPFSTVVYSADYTTKTPVSNVIPISSIGSSGMFLAIIAGILAARLYVFFLDKGWKIKMPDSVPSNVAKMFEDLIPGGMVFLVFLIVRFVMSLTPFGTAQALIYGVLQAPLTAVGGGLGGLLVYLLVDGFLWMFGIHGGMVAYVGMAPIITVMMTENSAAFAQGLACPHPEWALMGFVIMGGSGATLAMNLLMLSKKTCKSAQYRTLGKIALAPSLFNINEPLIFGSPIIMNPYLAVPFIFTPIVNTFLCLFAMKIGFFVPTGASISTFMPFGIFGALLCGSWTGIVMSFILLAVDLVIYFPFFKASDNHNYQMELASMKSAEASADETDSKVEKAAA